MANILFVSDHLANEGLCIMCLRQALRFFWASRHVFLGGMGKDQAETPIGVPALAPTEAPAGPS